LKKCIGAAYCADVHGGPLGGAATIDVAPPNVALKLAALLPVQTSAETPKYAA